MKKKSILLTCIAAVMALAMFVGCDNAPVYPSFPTSGYVAQIGDFVEGQSFDASKFQVIATYLDGSKKVIEDASVLYTDANKDNKLSTGDTVSAIVGFDYNNNQLKGEGTVTVYPVERYEVTAAEKTYTVGDVSSADLSVTAYYINGKGELANMQVAASDAGLAASVSRDAETTGTMTVKIGDDVIAKIDVTVEEEVVEPFAKLKGIKFKAGAIAQYDYAEPIEFTFDDFEVTAYRDGSTTSEIVEDAEDLPGFEVKAVRGDGLDMQASDWAFKSQTRTSLKVVASFNGETVETSIPVAKPVITVAYRGEGIVEGTKLADVVLDPADFFITEKVSGRTPETAQIDAEDVELVLVDNNGDKFEADDVMPAYDAANNGKVYVKATYNGVDAAKTVAVEALSANYAKEITITQVTLVDGYSIAKQQYTTDINDTLTTAVIKSITATQDGETIEIDPDDVSVRYVSNTWETRYEAIDGTDTTGLSNLNIEVTYEYGGKSVAIAYAPVALTEAEVETVTLTPDYENKNASGSPMANSPITWIIETSNANGVIEEKHELVAEDVVWQNGTKLGEHDNLVATVSADAAYEVMIVVDGVESNIVNVPVGAGYINVASINVKLADTYKAYIDERFSKNTSDYAIDLSEGKAWTTTGTTSAVPTVDSVEIPSSVALITKEAQTVTVNVKYLAASGKEEIKKCTVDVSGTAWGEISALKLVWADDKSNVTAIPVGQHNWNDFAVEGYKGHGDNGQLTITKQNLDSPVTSASSFNCTLDETITITFSYTEKGKTEPTVVTLFDGKIS